MNFCFIEMRCLIVFDIVNDIDHLKCLIGVAVWLCDND